MDPARVKFCKKCDNAWKPERAHHCSECGCCIFQVIIKQISNAECIDGPPLSVGEQLRRRQELEVLHAVYHLHWHLSCLPLPHAHHVLLPPHDCQVQGPPAKGCNYIFKIFTNYHLQGYTLAFILCVVGFIEGILFTFFCFELVQEQFESIGDNQTYVDDMKETFGRPQALIDNL